MSILDFLPIRCIIVNKLPFDPFPNGDATMLNLKIRYHVWTLNLIMWPGVAILACYLLGYNLLAKLGLLRGDEPPPPPPGAELTQNKGPDQLRAFRFLCFTYLIL